MACLRCRRRARPRRPACGPKPGRHRATARRRAQPTARVRSVSVVPRRGYSRRDPREPEWDRAPADPSALVTFGRLGGLNGEERMMVYPAKVTELKRLSAHPQVTVRVVRTTAPLGT